MSGKLIWEQFNKHTAISRNCKGKAHATERAIAMSKENNRKDTKVYRVSTALMALGLAELKNNYVKEFWDRPNLRIDDSFATKVLPKFDGSYYLSKETVGKALLPGVRRPLLNLRYIRLEDLDRVGTAYKAKALKELVYTDSDLVDAEIQRIENMLEVMYVVATEDNLIDKVEALYQSRKSAAFEWKTAKHAAAYQMVSEAYSFVYFYAGKGSGADKPKSLLYKMSKAMESVVRYHDFGVPSHQYLEKFLVALFEYCKDCGKTERLRRYGFTEQQIREVFFRIDDRKKNTQKDKPKEIDIMSVLTTPFCIHFSDVFRMLDETSGVWKYFKPKSIIHPLIFKAWFLKTLRAKNQDFTLPVARRMHNKLLKSKNLKKEEDNTEMATQVLILSKAMSLVDTNKEVRGKYKEFLKAAHSNMSSADLKRLSKQ